MVALVLLLIARAKKWKTIYTDKEKDTWVALFLVSIFAVEGSLEAIYQDAPGGPRQLIALLTIIAVIKVVLDKDDRRIMIQPRMLTDDEDDPDEQSNRRQE